MWFASNAVLGDLQQHWGLAADALGYMTSAVQLGFIVGTLTFAFFAIADQFSARVVFLACSLLGATANLGVYLLAEGLWSLLQLASSGLCCLLSPLLFYAPAPVYLAFLLFWGIVVPGDSPQFSALNAANAPAHLVGSALTIANCIGFAITIFSIQLLNYLVTITDPSYLFLVLALGPLYGLVSMMPLMRA
jgi:hypothetical protein